MRLRTPKRWRKGFSLWHRRYRLDSYGEQVTCYPDVPDLTVADGAEQGLCFQHIIHRQQARQVNGGVMQYPFGELRGGAVEAVIYGDLDVRLSDRLCAEAGMFEVKEIQQWPSYRLLLMDRTE